MAEEWRKQLFTQLTQGVVVLHFDGQQYDVLASNPAAEALLGSSLLATIRNWLAHDAVAAAVVAVQSTKDSRQAPVPLAPDSGRAPVSTVIEPLDGETVALFLDKAEGDSSEAEPTTNGEAAALLKSLTANLPIGLAFFDAHYRYVYIDQALADINGLSVEAHHGVAIRELLPINAEIVEPVLAQVFATGEAVLDLEVEGETPLRPGVSRTWLTSFFPVYSTGVVQFVGVLVVEVTNQREAEVALRESEMRFRNTFENAAVGIAHVGLDGRWLRVNQRLCSIVGRTESELLQTTFQAITHPDDLMSDLTQFEQLIQGKINSYQMEKRYFHRDGTIVWILLTTAMERDLDGNPLYCIAVIQDITVRKVAEGRLALLAQASTLLASSLDYNETLQRLADLVVQGIADWCSIEILQPDGSIEQVAIAHIDPARVEWAQALRRETSVHIDDGGSLAEVIRTGESLLVPEITDEVLRAAAEDAVQLELLRSLKLQSSIVVPLTTRGNTLGALTLITAESLQHYDESDLRFVEELARRAAVAIDNALLYKAARTAENDLRAINETLEQRIQERTRDLERSNRELQEFAYVASHDLQEPLRKVMAFGDRLQRKYAGELDESGVDYIVRMQQAAGRMQRLINDLLALSRVTTRGHPFERVDLDQTLDDVMEDLGTLIEESGASLIVDPLPVIAGDSSQLHQLFQNLIVNAIKFHRDDVAPVVQVCLDSMQPPEQLSSVRLLVSDNGIGFDEAYADRIFQPFQRLHGRDQYEGTGMGLAICRRIVERHGGTIEAKSTVDAGTTFVVTLPTERDNER